jgi:hypothetical protein
MDKIHPPTKSTKLINDGQPRKGVSGNWSAGLSPATDGLRLETKTRESKDGMPSLTPRILRPLSPPVYDGEDPVDTPSPVEAVHKISSSLSWNRGTRSSRSSRSTSLPPSRNMAPLVSDVLRFQSTSASVASFTTGTIAAALGGVAVTTVSFQPWASSFRVKRVTVWPSASSSSVPNVELLWAAGTSGQVRDEVRSRTLPEGVTVTEGVVFVPTHPSLAQDWILSSQSATVFECVSPVGSVLDLEVEYTLGNIFEAGAVTVSAATAGKIYYRSLDGSGSYTAVSRPTI